MIERPDPVSERLAYKKTCLTSDGCITYAANVEIKI